MDDEHNDENTRLLLDTIRKELNSIINDNNSTETVANHLTKLKTDEEKYTITDTNCSKGDEPSCSTVKLDGTKANMFVKRAALLESQATRDIDDDLQKMQLELQRSYELFQNIGDKFETINFGKLHSRIKDLQLHTYNEKTSNLIMFFDKSYDNNQLRTFTNELGKQLRAYPGEFGDIPEISAFFQACTKLQNGLLELKKQRQDVTDISKRLFWETENAHQRAADIRKNFNKDGDKKLRN